MNQSTSSKILILSPDTDIYHIGLPLINENKYIIIQINSYSSKDLTYISILALKFALANDSDLAQLPHSVLPQIFQTLYVVTGCDYISFFSGLGKDTCKRYFYQYAEFITSGKGNTSTPGTLADISLENEDYESCFLAFLRLVRVVYMKKHASGFITSTPATNFSHFYKDGVAPDNIRQTMWGRVQFENEMVPSTDTLHRHWK